MRYHIRHRDIYILCSIGGQVIAHNTNNSWCQLSRCLVNLKIWDAFVFYQGLLSPQFPVEIQLILFLGILLWSILPAVAIVHHYFTKNSWWNILFTFADLLLNEQNFINGIIHFTYKIKIDCHWLFRINHCKNPQACFHWTVGI